MVSISSAESPVAITSSAFVIAPSTRESTNASVGPIGRSRMLTPLTNVSAPSRMLSPTVDSPRTIAPPSWNSGSGLSRAKYPFSTGMRLVRFGRSKKSHPALHQRALGRAPLAKMQRLSFRRPARFLGRIALVLGGLCITAAARAADPGAAPIAVILHSESTELDFTTLIQALNEELEVPTVPGDSASDAGTRG